MLSEDEVKVTRLRDFWPDRPKEKGQPLLKPLKIDPVDSETALKEDSRYREGRLCIYLYRWALLLALIIGCAGCIAGGEPVHIVWMVIGAATLYFPTCLALAIFDLVDIHHEQLAISKKRLEVVQKHEREEEAIRAKEAEKQRLIY